MKYQAVKLTLTMVAILLLFLSCVSPLVRESIIVPKVDSKIIEELHTHVENDDFYGACQSFIEYSLCCSDERKETLVREIEELYKKNVAGSSDLLSSIEYTYSFIKLAEGNIEEDNLSVYREDLSQYVHQFIESELQNKGELEKISWLLYLSGVIPDDPYPYKSLIHIYMQRENPLLAQKYFTLYSNIVKAEDIINHDDELKVLAHKVKELEDIGKQENDIEATIESSVKIVVDKGIKTESGVGMPDQVMGTGVVIDERGYILTNYHLIESSVDPTYEGYSRVYVIQGRDENVRIPTKITGYDPVFDLALLKIEKKIESHVKFGDSDTLKQGEKVFAIGNPVGLTNTVTSGVVSSLDRPFLQIGNIIQIDAALNPGNSGGALINSNGYLVGIAFAGLENFENLNFAIPSNLILSVLFRLYDEGEVSRSWMGCGVERRDDNILINYIVPEGPADYAKLQDGDLVREVNRFPVKEIFDIQRVISSMGNPLVISVMIERDNKLEHRNILLGKRPQLPSLYVWRRDAHENIVTPLFGIVITRLDPSRKRHYLVTRIVNGTVASSAGISEGDVIKIKSLKYDEKYEVFSLSIDLKSKRFGYLNKSMVLYSYNEINTFI